MRCAATMRTCATLFLALAAGCTGPLEMPLDGDVTEDCSRVDEVCPPELPLSGSACAGELSCSYRELTENLCPPATCRDGRWQIACVLSAPQLAEHCRDPEIGPFDALSAEIDVEPEIRWGLQGSAMIGYRLRLDAPEDAPRCVRVHHRVEAEGEMTETVYDLRLRCGRTELVQLVLPLDPCEERAYDVDLEVEVEGLAPIERRITATGGVPPGPSSCGDP